MSSKTLINKDIELRQMKEENIDFVSDVQGMKQITEDQVLLSEQNVRNVQLHQGDDRGTNHLQTDD